MVLLEQPPSVQTAQGGFRKGHLAELKSVLEGAGTVEFMQVVPDTLSLFVVYADAQAASRAVDLRSQSIQSVRRLSAKEDAGFWASVPRPGRRGRASGKEAGKA